MPSDLWTIDMDPADTYTRIQWNLVYTVLVILDFHFIQTEICSRYYTKTLFHLILLKFVVYINYRVAWDCAWVSLCITYILWKLMVTLKWYIFSCVIVYYFRMIIEVPLYLPKQNPEYWKNSSYSAIFNPLLYEDLPHFISQGWVGQLLS